MPAARLLRHLVALAARGAFFDSPHRGLPPRLRFGSDAFASLVVTWVAAALLRQQAGEVLAVGTLLALLAAVLVVGVAVSHAVVDATALGLFLCVSAGVDAVAAALAVIGVPIGQPLWILALLGWKALATLSAVQRRRQAQWNAPDDDECSVGARYRDLRADEVDAAPVRDPRR